MKNKKQKGILAVFLLCVCFFISGCITRIEKEQKRKDLEYILIDQEHLPEEMIEVLGQLKKKAFHFVYSDQGKTYLAEGYGACPTTGYTIEVKELYETEHAVCLNTSLMGPATGEETKEITTFPYIVVEISETEKEVMFD